jgi:hypothetical protein
METGGWDFVLRQPPRGLEVRGRTRWSRVPVAAAALMLAALVVCGLGGCADGQVSEGDPTPDLSVATTGTIQTTSSSDSTETSDTTDALDTTGTTQVAGTTQVVGTTLSSTTSTVVGMELGTRRNPIPVGQEAQVGDWTVKVVDAVLDATQLVTDENMFNDPPESGSQYVLVTIEATYTGEESSTFWVEMMYKFVGSKGNTFDSGMVVAPDSILDDGEVFSGGTVAGNLAFVVESTQVSGGTLMIEEFVTFDETRLFFAVD